MKHKLFIFRRRISAAQENLAEIMGCIWPGFSNHHAYGSGHHYDTGHHYDSGHHYDAGHHFEPHHGAGFGHHQPYGGHHYEPHYGGHHH